MLEYRTDCKYLQPVLSCVFFDFNKDFDKTSSVVLMETQKIDIDGFCKRLNF